MFGLFKTNSKELAKNSMQEKLANTIVTKSLQLQERWAAFMQRKTEQLSDRSKKYTIVLFCLLAGGYSLYTIGESLSINKKKSIAITSIKTPNHITQKGGEINDGTITISEHEFNKIQTFKSYMDSLGKSVTGRKIADSILLNRPGLMDSIIQLERLYHLNQSKK